MIPINDYIKQLQNLINNFDNDRIRIAMSASFDVSAAAKSRVINRRENADGQIFGEYSDSYWNVKRAKLGNDRRINFSETNRMWSSTNPTLESVSANEVAVRVKPSLPDREEIMGYHEDRFGKIIQLNDQEREELNQIYNDRMHKNTLNRLN